MNFELPLGIDIPDISGLKSGYKQSDENRGCITALLSAEVLLDFIRGFTEAMDEPIFFFLELPCTADEEKELRKKDEREFHYKLYYLDNCTKPVIRAILKTYGSMLVNDGICRFGFGGNESGDELYVQSYKVMSIYCGNAQLERRTIGLLEKCGAQKEKDLLTPWDLLSPYNSGTCVRAEEDGINAYDIPELLADAGMYFAETV